MSREYIPITLILCAKFTTTITTNGLVLNCSTGRVPYNVVSSTRQKFLKEQRQSGPGKRLSCPLSHLARKSRHDRSGAHRCWLDHPFPVPRRIVCSGRCEVEVGSRLARSVVRRSLNCGRWNWIKDLNNFDSIQTPSRVIRSHSCNSRDCPARKLG